LPVNLGGALELVAYDLAPPMVAAGGTVTLTTFWRILDPAAFGPVSARLYGRSATLFVHVLDGANQVVGQEDRLDAPAWDWRAGDTFAQVHVLTLAAAAPPGAYRLEVGAYRTEDGVRLPALVGGQPVDDRILLRDLEVE
jgi:hypothetical protein